MQKIIIFIAAMFFTLSLSASYILIPMEHDKQTNHLKAYGITYWVINQGIEAYWLLNYRGGSFAFPHTKGLENELKVRGVSYQVISDAQWIAIRSEISDPELNQEAVKLEKAPKIAVYT
ncbi:MAG TPA: asparagine synthetase B, partial [Saprospiraceae bacterium]|nr:asparagine synthetase B [Saprospiraceae bacterium]